MVEPIKLRPLRTISPTRWQGREPPPREWMIEDIAVRKTTCLFSGVGGIGKTLLCQQLMTAAASGSTWLGRKVSVCRSFAFFAEDPEPEVWRRQTGIGKHYGIEAGDLDDIDMMTLDDIDNPTLWQATNKDPTGYPTPLWLEIEAFIRERGHQIVILDNVNAIFGANSNYPEHVRPFLQRLNMLARDIDGLVVLIQHPSASGELDGFAQAGTRVWRNTVRSQIIMNMPKESTDDEAANTRVLQVGKNNYGKRGQPIRMQWEEGVFVPLLVSESKGGRLGQFETLELKSHILKVLRDLIPRGNKFAIAQQSKNNVGSALKKLGGIWNGYTAGEIRAAVEMMLSSGQIVTVTIGTGQRAIVVIRPGNVTYPGEVVVPPALL